MSAIIRSLVKLMAVVSIVLPQIAFCATTQGTLGTSSTGTADLTLAVSDLVMITGMESLDLGTFTGAAGDLEDNADVCVYTNKSGGTYNVTATGDGTGNAFTITDGTNDIPYDVYYNDVSGTTGGVLLVNGAQTAQTGANTTSQSCGGVDNANYRVVVDDADLATVPSGTYLGVLTLLVEPL